MAVERESLPDCLEVTAWTQDADGQVEEVMGLCHRTLEIEGVQFHPESILTEHGHRMLRNFLRRTAGDRVNARPGAESPPSSA